jgi:phosphoglycolate phosphatase
LLQVDEVDTCVVFNEEYDGYKFSVRSCIEEVNANELAAYLSQGIGSGGGHSEKAGGFISMKLYEKEYPTINAAGYFNNRMTEYFDEHEILHTENLEFPTEDMELYHEKKFPDGFVHLASHFFEGSSVLVRTGFGDMRVEVTDDKYLVFGWAGDVHVLTKKQFDARYEKTEEIYEREEWTQGSVYVPRLKYEKMKRTLLATECAKICLPKGDTLLYAKKLDKAVKIFAPQNRGKYVLRRPGDYLTVRKDNLSEVTVMNQDTFEKGFELADAKNLSISQ